MFVEADTVSGMILYRNIFDFREKLYKNIFGFREKQYKNIFDFREKWHTYIFDFRDIMSVGNVKSY